MLGRDGSSRFAPGIVTHPSLSILENAASAAGAALPASTAVLLSPVPDPPGNLTVNVVPRSPSGVDPQCCPYAVAQSLVQPTGPDPVPVPVLVVKNGSKCGPGFRAESRARRHPQESRPPAPRPSPPAASPLRWCAGSPHQSRSSAGSITCRIFPRTPYTGTHLKTPHNLDLPLRDPRPVDLQHRFNHFLHVDPLAAGGFAIESQCLPRRVRHPVPVPGPPAQAAPQSAAVRPAPAWPGKSDSSLRLADC